MQRQTQKYLDAVYTASVVRSSISGRIVTVSGEIYTLTDADIIPGSLNKNNRCVNGSSFEFGAVYQGELNVTLKKSFDRYKLMGGSISFIEHRCLLDDTTEDVDIGIFYIASADRSKKLTTIKAIDSMGDLDIGIADDMVGTPYSLLTAMADNCGVHLAQAEDEIEALPNGQQTYAVSVDTTETYRDMVAYLGMMTGTFATINVKDQLELKAYALENCIRIPASKRISGSTIIADYVTYYKGIRARFISTENYAPYEYIDDTIVDGLILDLGDVPIVRGLPETKNAMLQALFDTAKRIRYVPAEFTLVTSDAALELGDRIGIGGEDLNTYITSYNWIYHGSEKIKGVGDNPRLKASKDKTSKQMASLEEKINAKDVIVHTYTNIAAYTLKSQEKEIISINYATITNARIIFIATIPFAMDLDGYIIFSYYVDGVLVAEDTVRQYAARGEHFATISNNMTMEKDTRRTLVVKACTQYYESDTRQQDARIRAIENYITTQKYTEQPVDATLPVANIAAGAIKAVLYAQGLAGTEVWDGTINIADYITPMGLPMLPMAGIIVDVALKETTGPGQGILEGIAPMNLPMLSLVGIVAEAAANQIVTNYTFDTAKSKECQYNSIYVSADGSYRLNTAYYFAGSSQDIDRGSMCAVVISTTEFTTVRSITLTAGSASTPGAKYLIACEGIFYNIVDGTLTKLPVTDLTADDFAAYGNDEAPDGSWLLGMDNPQVLCWAASQDALPALAAHVVAIPGAQAVISGVIDLSHDSIKGIESMTAKCEGPLILGASVDDQHTWMAWNGTEWISLSEAYSGMSKEALEAVTADQWQQLISGAREMHIRISLVSEEQTVSEIYISFINQEEYHGD